MPNKLTKRNIKYFFSYQFIENKKKTQNCLNFVNNLKIQNQKNFEIDYYIEKIDEIFRQEIYKNILGKNKLGVFISGGIDSFLLLFYIRELFPNLEIYTFTFFPREASKEEILQLTNLSKKFGTIHKNYFQYIGFNEILNELNYIYSNSKILLGDEGLLYSNILARKLKKDFDIDYIVTGDGVDILFSGMSMYKNSLLERLNNSGTKFDISNFENKYDYQYFNENIKKYENNFFYKYGEYFGGEFLDDINEKIRKTFFNYYNKIKNISILKKEILFNYIFLVSNRGKVFTKQYGKINKIKVISLFFSKSFAKKIIKLNIPDNYLLNQYETKIIIRKLADKVKKENNIDFNFLPTMKIDFYTEFNKNIKYIIYIGKYLFDNGYITKNHYESIGFFIKNSMWYENKIRIYLLLNLYYYIKNN